MADAFHSICGQRLMSVCWENRIKSCQSSRNTMCVFFFTNCHSKVNISPSANWLPHQTLQLLEGTSVTLTTIWQFSLPMWQHVEDWNIGRVDINRYSWFMSLCHSYDNYAFSASLYWDLASQQQVTHNHRPIDHTYMGIFENCVFPSFWSKKKKKPYTQAPFKNIVQPHENAKTLWSTVKSRQEYNPNAMLANHTKKMM